MRPHRLASRLLALAAFATLGAASPALADRAPPPQRFELDGNQLILPRPFVFETGSDTLTQDSNAALRLIMSYLEDKSYISTLRIEGHVAGGGDEAKNQELSEKRALAVTRRLVEYGVDCKRLLPVGFGSSKPVAANDTAEGRAANTRVAAFNAALKGRAIGGMPLDGGGRVAGDPCAK